ncbi:glycoside hydrolase family protein [Bifidobacterium eulemuris]|uniref:Uncharacterized protein n=1 Tax=Bifidobacterium eulemuris TaxID=1765219 RepID=A0A7L9SNQ1_9BIFI|nr:hypothetical protein [Bifidobacterium eulemuris]QOL31800.1 hypothetical protein BE0216_04460 [Bifidobacterium eulemuris]
MTIRQERSRDFLNVVSGELAGVVSNAGDGDVSDGDGLPTCVGWQLVAEKVGVGMPNGEVDEQGASKVFTRGEGPTIFPANPGDVNGYAWYLFIDQPRYHDGPGHYVGFATRDASLNGGWEPVGGKLRECLPTSPDGGKPRHGMVIPITAAERGRLVTAYGDADSVIAG